LTYLTRETGQTLTPAPVTSLTLAGILAGCGGKPSPWTSHARFTISQVGTYTAADPTVPAGFHGNAEIDLGMGLAGNREDFLATIGDDPADDTNVSQWQLIFRGYHGPGTYTVTPASGGEIQVTVRDYRGDVSTWDSEHSAAAGCAIRITADTAMRDPAIREIRGSLTCHALRDDRRHTTTTTLSGHFDVFAEVWCRGDQQAQACHPPRPIPVAPRD
jgi:hypothetical protein